LLEALDRPLALAYLLRQLLPFAAKPDYLLPPAQTTEALSVPERLLLLCVAARIDFKHTKIAERLAIEAVVKGMITRDTGGQLALTDRGRAGLRAMLPDI
jgi:hypothetical protein